jgi:hypothetical protein
MEFALQTATGMATCVARGADFPAPPTTENTTMNAKPSLDGISKQKVLDAEMEWATIELLLETLETRKSDRLDFHEIPVWSIRDLVRHAFESGYREGLHTGYRQGRGDATREAARDEAPTSPRNPELTTT